MIRFVLIFETCVSVFCCVVQNKEKPLSKLLQRGEDVVFDQVRLSTLNGSSVVQSVIISYLS